MKCIISLAFLLGTAVINVETEKFQGPSVSEADIGEFPYFAFILRKTERTILAGGILVSPNLVLTDSFVFLREFNLSANDLTIVLGTHNRSEDEPSRQELNAIDITYQPEFVATLPIYPNMTGNIAVIQLEESAALNDRVQVFPSRYIAKTTRQDKKVIRAKGNRCVVPGYGRVITSPFQTILPRTLQKMSIKMVDNSFCREYFGRTYGQAFPEKNFLCSKNDDLTEARRGDWGGPLLCKIKGGYRLHGTIARGTYGGEVPGYVANGYIFYVRLSNYRFWVLRRIAEANN